MVIRDDTYRCPHCKEPAREVTIAGDRNRHVRVTHLSSCTVWLRMAEKWPMLVSMRQPITYFIPETVPYRGYE